MTFESALDIVVDALALPPEARIDARVPKKLLIEQGAPTAADKRAIQEGVDELHWRAACKPSIIGIPSFADEQHEYLEIAVVTCAFRPGAKGSRLIELIHRAIPYPIVLVTSDAEGVTVSLAHKRHAENQAGKVVIDRIVAVATLRPDQPGEMDAKLLANLPLARQPNRDLWTLYEGWMARIDETNAARLTGTFVPSDDPAVIARRRTAMDEDARLVRTEAQLRSQTARAKQISQRVDLNQRIKTLQAAIAENKKLMLIGTEDEKAGR